MIRTQIPIRAEAWDVDRPGFAESDTVAHCGGSMAGAFIWSVTLTDIHTEWTEIQAMFHKGAQGALEAVKCIENKLPFPLLAFDCDNGGEFLNYHLLRHKCLSGERKMFWGSRLDGEDEHGLVQDFERGGLADRCYGGC